MSLILLFHLNCVKSKAIIRFIKRVYILKWLVFSIYLQVFILEKVKMTRSKRLLYIAVTLLGAVFVLIYRGSFWPFVRGHVGDWLVIQCMYLVARFWVSDRWRYYLAGAVFLSGVLVEVIKFFAAGSIPHTFIAEMTLGSIFDPLDLIAFALGVATVLIIEQAQSKPKLGT
mgnify:CR=1 FL=1